MTFDVKVGLRQADLRPCDGCGRGLLEQNTLTIHRVHIECFVANPLTIRRQAELEMMLGNAALAHVMGPDEVLAPKIDEKTLVLCFHCYARKSPAELMELALQKDTVESEEDDHV